jgi:hypothetical protein
VVRSAWKIIGFLKHGVPPSLLENPRLEVIVDEAMQALHVEYVDMEGGGALQTDSFKEKVEASGRELREALKTFLGRS